MPGEFNEVLPLPDEQEICMPFESKLAEVLPPGGELAIHELEHDDEPPLPLHAVAPFFGLVIQLACAVCTGIILTNAAVTTAKVTTAITTPVTAATLPVVLACVFVLLVFTLALLYHRVL